jgi:hypothetical protein
MFKLTSCLIAVVCSIAGMRSNVGSELNGDVVAKRMAGDSFFECVTSGDSCPSEQVPSGTFCSGGVGSSCHSCTQWQLFFRYCNGPIGGCLSSSAAACGDMIAGTCILAPSGYYKCQSLGGATMGTCAGNVMDCQ